MSRPYPSEPEPTDDEVQYQDWLKEHVNEVATGEPASKAKPALGGWGVVSPFGKRVDAYGDTNRTFFGSTLFFVLLALLGIGYYTYHQVKGATYLGHVATNPNIDVESGLVAHWTFDGPDITDRIYDQAGSYHGYFTGGATSSAKTTGIIGQSMVFDGVDDRVIIPGLTTGTTFTIVGWIRPEGQIANSGQIIGLNEDNCFEYQKGGKLLMNYSGGWNNSNTSMTDNEWHLVAMVVSGGNGTYYLDGRPDGTKTGIGSANYTGIGSNGAEPFKGRIDDLRFYNRALSDAEMKALYAMTKKTVISSTVDTGSSLESGLVGHWTFDGPQMDWASTTGEVKNSVSGGVRGNVTNFTSSAATAGKTGQALTFDGTDDYIDIPYQGLDFERTDPFTISAWAKWEDFSPVGGPQAMLGRYATPGGIARGVIYMHRRTFNATFGNANSVNFYLLSGVANSHLMLTTATNSFPPNVWTHVVVTYDGSSLASGVKIYKNGVSEAITVLDNDVTSTIKTGTNWRIGDDYTSDYTKGQIDDVRIYNRALSADEVAELYILGGGSKIEICREASVQDADGNTYNTLAIGSQCWLDRNMNVGTRIAAATTQTNNGTIEKYCYSNSDANCTTNNPNKPDGGLYQWNEAMQYSTTEGARGICPVGFHIPTDAEWHILEKFLKDSGQSCDGNRSGVYDCSPAGTKLQPGGSSRFEGNRAGFAISGSSVNRGTNGYWWSSSPSGGNAWLRYVGSGEARVLRSANTQTFGFSVRCLQD